MIPVLLTSVKTRDGIRLDGIYAPPKHKNKTALIWLHGLGSRFSSGQVLIQELSSALSKSGIGYFKFNNRGHDVVNRDGQEKKKFQGCSFEKFQESVYDIRAMIGFAKRIGYKKIILAGHSTGANKALYYMYKTEDRSVKGMILAGALSDMSLWGTGEIGGAKIMRRALADAKTLVKKDRRSLIPQKYGIYSAERYISLYDAGHAEDVFPYHNSNARWKELKSIHIPVSVVIGSRDKYLDRSPQELIEAFRKNALKTKNFTGMIIKGAGHNFAKKEKELAKIMVDWIKRIKV